MSFLTYATETVWVVHYGHRHGDDVSVFATEELAWGSVAAILNEWAPQEIEPEAIWSEIETLLEAGTVDATRKALTIYAEHVPTETIDVTSSPIYRQ